MHIRDFHENKNELEQSFAKHIKPLLAKGVTIRGVGFDNQFWICPKTISSNDVSVFVNMRGSHEDATRRAFMACFKPLLAKDEGMNCLLKTYNQVIKLHLSFLNDSEDCFQNNPYINQDVILALQVMRDGAMSEKDEAG